MKTLVVLVLCFTLAACNQSQKSNSEELSEIADTVEIENNAAIVTFPKYIGSLFEAHGGIARWKTMNNLSFELIKESGNEVHSTDLNSRKVKIEHAKWSIGYDAEQVWLNNKEEDAYNGNARFYHNLYFYFYAMPFIVADPGINYEQLANPLEIDGKRYIGTKISYGDGIGDSPEDEYIVYRDIETGKMAWLAYTVTFMSGEKSDNFKFINYAEWQEINGLLLPKKLTWYNVEDGKPTTPRNDNNDYRGSFRQRNICNARGCCSGSKIIKQDATIFVFLVLIETIVMKQLVTLFIVLSIFSCETEPLDGFDETASDEASLVFVVHVEGIDLAIAAENIRGDERYCASATDSRQLGLVATIINPDDSFVAIIITVAPAGITTHNLGDYAIADNFCFKASITALFFNSLGEEVESYASFSDYEGSGILEITDYTPFEEPFSSGGNITATFEATLGLRGPDGTPGGGSFYFYGTINKVEFIRGCESPFC